MFLGNKYISFSRNKAVSNSLTFIFQLLECYYTRGEEWRVMISVSPVS